MIRGWPELPRSRAVTECFRSAPQSPSLFRFPTKCLAKPAQVEGKIWLADRDDPLILRLTGNCHRDLAGRLLTFSNPKPNPDAFLQLTNVQAGVAGDITAARKVRVIVGFDASNWSADKPSHLANALYLEWYSETNGRVVIESTDYEITVSEPSWEMSDEEEAQQQEASSNALQAFLNRVAGVPDLREEAAYAQRAGK